MLIYEVTPLVYDLITHLRNSNGAKPIKALKGRYPKAEIRNALTYLEKGGFLKEAPSNSRRPKLKKRRGIRHLD